MKRNNGEDKLYKDIYLLAGWFLAFMAIGALVEGVLLLAIICGSISALIFYHRNNKYIKGKTLSQNEFTRNTILVCEFFFGISFIGNCIEWNILGMIISGGITVLLHLMRKYKYPDDTNERRCKGYYVRRVVSDSTVWSWNSGTPTGCART